MKRLFLMLAILFSLSLGFSNCASSNRASDEADEMAEDAGDEMEEMAEMP